MDRKTFPLGLRVEVVEDKSTYHTFRVSACVIQGESLYHQGGSLFGNDWEKPECAFEHLTFSLVSFSDSHAPSVHFTMDYRDCGYIGPSEVYAMAKTLKRLERGMEKISLTEGCPKSFGQYLNRVARLIGATYMLTPRNAVSRERSGEQYHSYSIGSAVDNVDVLTLEWFRSLKPETVNG